MANVKNYKYETFPEDIIPLTSGWIKSDKYSDEFNSFDNTKWRKMNDFAHSMSPYAAFKYYNVDINDGYLELSIKQEDPPLWLGIWYDTVNRINYYYSSGYGEMIDAIRYGYLEISCYLPNSEILRPCFWLWGSNGLEYDEIDVFERPGTIVDNKIDQNFNHNLNKPSQSHVWQSLEYDRNMFGIWATFAVEWLPNEITFFINGNITSRIVHTDNEGMISNNNIFTCVDIDNAIRQKIQLSYSLVDTITDLSLLNETFKVDYVRSYKLKEGFNYEYWPMSFSMSDPHIFKVHKKLRLGGTGHTANINTSENITLWAKEEIVFEQGFEVSANTKFTVRVIETDPELFIEEGSAIIPDIPPEY
ncbi:MAG: family 16 glycosylhydrolase [Bacteroidales bacterium]|nr:family 16 glycosylhydrolase [Bacteroidales bacterium]